MFENFVIFTEIVKLSSNIFCYMREVNYSDNISRLIFQVHDIASAEQVAELVEDSVVINKFIKSLLCRHKQEDGPRWLRLIFDLSKRINVDFESCGDMLLVYSCRYGYLDFVKYLLEEVGIDINSKYSYISVNGTFAKIRNSYGEPEEKYYLGFSIAAVNNHLNVVRYLVEEHKISLQNDYLISTLAGMGNLEIIKYLSQKGLDLHFNEESTLELAICNNRLEVIKYLVERPDCKVCQRRCVHGANLNLINPTSIRMAEKKNYTELLKYIKSRKQ